jgi:RNA polymerase sigma-70 factor (ECF subfamily)
MNGPHLSFPDIVRMYQQPLYWHIRRVVIVHEDAEDILQETFMKAFRHLWQLRSAEALRPWLFRIASNELNRYFRKHPALPSLEELPASSCCSLSEVQETDLPAAAAQVVSAAMLQMSPLQRQVFSMRYYEDMDYDQISRITGASKNVLAVSYHEARKKIEKQIDHA